MAASRVFLSVIDSSDEEEGGIGALYVNTIGSRLFSERRGSRHFLSVVKDRKNHLLHPSLAVDSRPHWWGILVRSIRGLIRTRSESLHGVSSIVGFGADPPTNRQAK
jgi:hypothetical protein